MKEPKQPKVHIIVLNYNRPIDTIECIHSILGIDYTNYEIIVVDNASTDKSYLTLIDHFKRLKVVQTGENLGYTGGINFGIREVLPSGPDYILILNNDTTVEKDFLTELVKVMEKYADAVAAGGLIIAEHDKKTIWYAGGRLIKWRGLAVHDKKGTSIDDYREEEERVVTFITGCMILLRTDKLEEIGLQEEKFFMYLDDIEYSARIVKKGYNLIYTPKSIIYHNVMDEKDDEFIIYYSVRNRMLLINTAFNSFFRVVASSYFLCVILAKLFFWSFYKRNFFRAGYCGLVDYFRKNFYKGRGVDLFLSKHHS
jgi:hypothetical protein